VVKNEHSHLDLRETDWCTEKHGILNSNKLEFRCYIILATQQCQTSYLSVKMGYLLSYGVLMDVKHSIKMELSYKVWVHGRYFINVHFFLSTPSLIILFISLHTFLLLFLCLYHWIMSIFFLAFVFCFFVIPQPDCPPSPPVLALSVTMDT